jgi:hypothetical protein
MRPVNIYTACYWLSIIVERDSRTLIDSGYPRLLSMRRYWCIIGRSILRSPVTETVQRSFSARGQLATYGAVVRSSFLLRIGSDIFT